MIRNHSGDHHDNHGNLSSGNEKVICISAKYIHICIDYVLRISRKFRRQNLFGGEVENVLSVKFSWAIYEQSLSMNSIKPKQEIQ